MQVCFVLDQMSTPMHRHTYDCIHIYTPMCIISYHTYLVGDALLEGDGPVRRAVLDAEAGAVHRHLVGRGQVKSIGGSHNSSQPSRQYGMNRIAVLIHPSIQSAVSSMQCNQPSSTHTYAHIYTHLLSRYRPYLPTYLRVHAVLEHVEQDLDVALGLHEPAHVGKRGEQVARRLEGREAGDDGVVGPVCGVVVG